MDDGLTVGVGVTGWDKFDALLMLPDRATQPTNTTANKKPLAFPVMSITSILID